MTNEITLADQSDTTPLRTLADQLGLPFAERLDPPNPPRTLVRGDFDRIAGSWGRQFSIVPIGEENDHVVVATSDPLNLEATEELRICYGRELKIVVTTPDEVARAINAVRTRLMSDRSSALSNEGWRSSGNRSRSMSAAICTTARASGN